MRSLTMNMNNLINCVILTSDEQQQYSLSQNATISSLIFLQFAVFSTSLSQEIVFSASLEIVFQSLSNNCIYCYERDYLLKKDCRTFNDDLKTKKFTCKTERFI